MKVAVTGANGKVGSALIRNLPFHGFEVKALDLPDFDATYDYRMVEETRGCDALIHLAWRGVGQDGLVNVHSDNRIMYKNAYEAAVVNRIGLVIMGSSNHAHSREGLESAKGRIKYTGEPERPNNAYGEEKQAMETMGKEYAERDGLAVVCLRIGNVNDSDTPNPDHVPSRWLSHRDLGQLVSKALTADLPPGHFEVMYAVSDQETFDWTNSFGYIPKDAS